MYYKVFISLRTARYLSYSPLIIELFDSKQSKHSDPRLLLFFWLKIIFSSLATIVLDLANFSILLGFIVLSKHDNGLKVLTTFLIFYLIKVFDFIRSEISILFYLLK